MYLFLAPKLKMEAARARVRPVPPFWVLGAKDKYKYVFIYCFLYLFIDCCIYLLAYSPIFSKYPNNQNQ